MALCLGLMGLATAVASTPTVNGLYHGDGDDAYYQLYATSYYGSGLYNYFDAASNRLYVALVVDHSVNDTVCSADQAYTSSAGWGNKKVPCDRKVDSEYAEFTLACAPESPNNWTWRQRVGDPLSGTAPESDWESTVSCVGGSCATFGTNGMGLGMESETSWSNNVNEYQSEYPYGNPWPPASGVPWDMYVTSLSIGGPGNNSWKSPFLSGDPGDVTQVPGYPEFTTFDQLGAYTPDKGWEWTLVYEWSVDLGPDGANCGGEPIWLITGLSHHSPLKNPDPDIVAECGNDEQNDCFPDPDPNDPPQILTDWGDLPDLYGTTFANDGARHYIIANNSFLGQAVQSESDGQPTADATGDGSEEDGVVFLTPFLPGEEALIQVTAGTAGYLSAFMDFNNNGILDQITLISATGPAAVAPGAIGDTYLSEPGVYTLRVSVPGDATGILYSRFRFTNNVGDGGDSSTGLASSGEVEDYALSSVGDFVWLDENGNGLQDGGEAGVPNITVSLLDAESNPVLGAEGEPVTTITDENGYYEFPGVPPGDYRMEFDAQSFTSQGAGNDTDVDSDASPATGITPVFSLGAGQTRNDIDAGLTEIPTAVSIGEIGLGTVRVEEFLEYIGAGGRDEEGLRALLASWDPAAGQSGEGRDALWQSLVDFLDPDGDGRVAILRWETMEERGTIGFYVDRRGPDGTWLRINDTLLPGLITAPMGGEYWLADPGALAETTHEYRLIEQEARGGLREYGPFRLSPEG